MKKILLFTALPLFLFSLCSCGSSQCTVKFYSEDTLLYTTKVHKGDTAVYYGYTPKKEGTVAYHYTFSGWDHNLKNVIESFSTYAQFLQIADTYTVTFVNTDGTVLDTETVTGGETAVYNGITPSKDGTSEYYYVYSGWDKSLENITEDTTITATYDEFAISTEGLTFIYDAVSTGYYLETCSAELTHVYLPDIYDDGTNGEANIIGIKTLSLYNNSTLQEIHLSKNITVNGLSSVLSYCHALSKITISQDAPYFQVYEGGLYTKGSNPELVCYPSCYNSTSITFLEGVTTIRGNAFANNQHLTSVSLPSTVTSVGVSCFSGCAELVSVTMPDSVTTLSTNLVINCPKVTSVVLGKDVTVLPSGTFGEDKALKEVTLPSKLVSIRKGAFDNNAALETVHIPESVTTIEHGAFQRCNAITTFDLQGNNTHFKVIDGGLYDYDVTTLIAYELGDRPTSYVMPNTVTTLGAFVFNNQSSLKSVTFSSSLKTIEERAFTLALGLTGITFPASLTTIETYAFYTVSNNKSYIIPSGVVNIGDSAFDGNPFTILYLEATSVGSGFASDWDYGVSGRYFYSDSEITNTWHYVDGVPTVRK